MKGHDSLLREIAGLIDSRTFEAVWDAADRRKPSRLGIILGAILDVIECRISGHKFDRRSRPTERGMEFTYSCKRCGWERTVDC